MVSRAALINELKRRGVKGSLSKMNRAQLRELHVQATRAATDENSTLDVTAGAAATVLPQGGSGISLAPLSIEAPRKATQDKPRAGLQGSGAYRDFVRANIGKHKGDMKAVAAAYRAQKGGGDAHKQFMDATDSYCQSRQKGSGHKDKACKCKGPDVHQYMSGGHWWNDAWSDVKHVASDVGHGISTAYHAVQNNPVVREVETKVANVGIDALARAGEGVVDAAADTASFLVGQPELAAAADVGVHQLANLAQAGVKKGVDHLIQHTAQ